MSRSEDIQPLSSYYDKQYRFNLHVESHRFSFSVHRNALSKLARFSGFSQLTILSTGFLPSDEVNDQEAISKVRNLSNKTVPIKAQWKGITIYINIPKIRSRLSEDYTDEDLSHSIEDVIKKEIAVRAIENFNVVNDYDLVLKDIVPILILSIALKSILEHKYGKFEGLEGSLILMASTGIKILFSNIDSLVHYLNTEYGARWTLLEGRQKERKRILPLILKSASLISLTDKLPK